MEHEAFFLRSGTHPCLPPYARSKPYSSAPAHVNTSLKKWRPGVLSASSKRHFFCCCSRSSQTSSSRWPKVNHNEQLFRFWNHSLYSNSCSGKDGEKETMEIWRCPFSHQNRNAMDGSGVAVAILVKNIYSLCANLMFMFVSQVGCSLAIIIIVDQKFWTYIYGGSCHEIRS